MKRVWLLAILILALPLIAGAQEQQSTVYLFRGRDTADYPPQVNVLNPEAVVYLDGKEFLSLPERTFIGFRIPAGRYVLSMRGGRARRSLSVEAGKTYYLQVEQVVYPNAYQIIYDAEEKTALDAIRRCYTLKEKKIRLKQFEAIKVKPGARAKS